MKRKYNNTDNTFLKTLLFTSFGYLDLLRSRIPRKAGPIDNH